MSTRHRSVAALLAVAGLLVVSAVLASGAMAMPPTSSQHTATGSVTLPAGTLCSFSIQLDGTQTWTSTQFFDQNGTLTTDTARGFEQDTFSANGKTLVGDPYPFTFVYNFADGALISDYGIGVAERVPLPNGGSYIVAGRINLLETPPQLIMTVDSGNSGINLDAFCAALS